MCGITGMVGAVEPRRAWCEQDGVVRVESTGQRGGIAGMLGLEPDLPLVHF